MTPRFHTLYPSPIGELLLIAEDNALAEISFWPERPHDAGEKMPGHPVLSATARWLDGYFDGTVRDFPSIPLVFNATPFRSAVWRELCLIPWGCTTTYGAIAREIERATGRRTSPRAVGGAVGANPICVLIPCHRVIGADGSLTGFGGGLERKAWLLQHEHILLGESRRAKVSELTILPHPARLHHARNAQNARA